MTVVKIDNDYKTTSSNILAYCAGVIDSDGYIGVKCNTYSVRVVGDSKQPTYSERVCVKQVEPHAVTLLHSLFKGSFYREKPSLKRGKPLYSWQITDRRAADCLYVLLPFLRIKKEQAINCLSLRKVKEESKVARLAFGRGHVGSAHRLQKHSISMEQCFQKAKSLNVTGIL